MERVTNHLFHLTEIMMTFSLFFLLLFCHWPGDILNKDRQSANRLRGRRVFHATPPSTLPFVSSHWLPVRFQPWGGSDWSLLSANERRATVALILPHLQVFLCCSLSVWIEISDGVQCHGNGRMRVTRTVPRTIWRSAGPSPHSRTEIRAFPPCRF